MQPPVYLDNAATTALDPRVLEAMLPHLSGRPGNPSSLHSSGTEARAAVDRARASVAALVGATEREILFTSGGTEADNLAVFGLAAAAGTDRRHAVVSAVEHAAVRRCADRLEAMGYDVTRLPVDAGGLVSPEDVAAALRPDTALAAVMWANNEVGAVQPIEEIAAVCAEADIPLHVDAVQGAGRIEIDTRRVPVSTLALSSHKIYGPQGVGALYVREGVAVEPLLHGGGQEDGRRSGTENVVGIVGFGEAARLAREELVRRTAHEAALRDRIIAGVEAIPGVRLNGHRERRLSNNVHVAVDGLEAEGLVLLLDAEGFAVGKGSACSSGGHKASPVLVAMGMGEREAFSALRITVGKENTFREVDAFVEALARCVGRLRELSPLYAGERSS